MSNKKISGNDHAPADKNHTAYLVLLPELLRGQFAYHRCCTVLLWRTGLVNPVFFWVFWFKLITLGKGGCWKCM